jgi:hypothetical protein
MMEFVMLGFQYMVNVNFYCVYNNCHIEIIYSILCFFFHCKFYFEDYIVIFI